MLYQEKNDFGVISIDNTYLNQLLRDLIKPFEGNVWLAKYDGLKQQDFMIKLGSMESLYNVYSSQSEKGIYIRVYLIIKFGTSISKVSNAVISGLADTLRGDFGLEIDNIVVDITGIRSTKGITKKNILRSYHDHSGE